MPVLRIPCGTPSGAISRSPALHWQLAAFEQKYTVAGEHLVHLVHARMGVKFVRLTGLEGIQADQQPRRLEQRRLAHLVRPPDGIPLRLNHDRMVHRLIPFGFLQAQPFQGNCPVRFPSVTRKTTAGMRFSAESGRHIV